MALEKSLGRVGVIGRFKPLHLGGQRMLEALCAHAEHVVIGIGSCNKYNARNPFTPKETEEMIEAVLSKNYTDYSFVYLLDFGHIPKYADGTMWKECIKTQFGTLNYFVTGNPYVRDLLEDTYTVIHPHTLITREQWIKVTSSDIRLAIAQAQPWKHLVPEQVAEYLETNNLVNRFKTEFGLETIARLSYQTVTANPSELEKNNVQEE